MSKIEDISEFYINKMEQQLQEINEEILIQIGKKIKAIGTLSPTQAMQIVNILKYGGSYKDIRKKINKITGKSYAYIDKMFEEITKQNQYLAKDFYKYKNMPFVPLEKNEALKNYVYTFTNVIKTNYENMLNSNILGYGFINDKGEYEVLGIRDTINNMVDKALMAITQGKSTFQEEMYGALKKLGGSGLRIISNKTYIDKEGNVKNYSKRLDTSLRMYMLDSTREFSNNLQLRFGEEFGADGVEITVHENPAPDHAPLQGRQFTNEEFLEIQAGKYGRAIGEYNCYHGILTIVLGVNKPQYTDKQLQEILDRNEKGFEYKGQHYTLYEGTQIQRRLETEIRKAKDTQILAKASGNTELILDSQSKITKLNNQYMNLCKESGLLPQKQRARVSGYRRISTVKTEALPIQLTKEKLIEKLNNKKIDINIKFLALHDKELNNKVLTQLDVLTDKYKHNKISTEQLTLRADDAKAAVGLSYYTKHQINLNPKYFNNKKDLIDIEVLSQKDNWHININSRDLDLYTITHEYGHIVEYEYFKETFLKKGILPKNVTKQQRKIIDTELRNSLINKAIKKLDVKIGKKEFKNKYWSGYAKYRNNFEWFAEAFVETQLTNNSNVWIDTFKEWLDEFYR